jgi:TPP-dependent pyruvate/acetoin dehydrogenase alpha subunit
MAVDERGGAMASPAARRRARELGIDLADVRGRGPGGRITAADVEQLAPGAGKGGAVDTAALPLRVDQAEPGERPAERTDEELVHLYRQMARVRAVEEQVIKDFADGLIPGSTHPSVGQEAIPVGTMSELRADDLALATYRGHGEALIKGVDPVGLFAELMTRANGLCKGKGGSMHLSDPDVGLISTNAIVAGHIPMAGGVALAEMRRRSGKVVAVYFGDGASCEGEFFETLNMAQLWRVPLIFVCQNNGIALSVPATLSQSTPDIADRARGCGITAEIVDGNDVLAVAAAMRRAVAHARGGEGPYFIEAKTVRWERHSALSGSGDQDAARARRQSVDPLGRFRKCLLAWGVATGADLDAVEADMRAFAAEASARAAEGPFAGPETVWEDVYAARR